MAILTEYGNEYEVQIVNAVTGQSFKEYVMLGDRKIHGDREAERYTTAYPGIMFKIQITLKTSFQFKPFDAVEANLYFKGQNTYCSLAVLNDPNPDHSCTKQDLRMEIACVNMSNCGKNVIGAPFVFKELKIDEKLLGQTDIVGANPIDLGSFFVILNRRKIASTLNNYLPRDTTTGLWNAEKVDKSSFKEQGSRTLLGFLNRSDVVPYPLPLYHNSWKSLTNMGRRYALKGLRNLCRSRRELSPNFTLKHRESEEWRSWNDMQPSERETVFLKFQNEQKEFERGVVREHFSASPANRSIILNYDGTAQRSAHPQELAKIKRVAQGPPNTIKKEIKPSNEVSTRNSKSKTIQKHKMNKVYSDLACVDLPYEEPLAKRRKITQKPIGADTIDNSKIRQEPIGFDTLDEKATVLKKEATTKYDLTELIDAVALLEPSTPSTNPEDSVYWEMAAEVLRQTADEFVRIRG